MSALESIRAGRLQEALQSLQQEVRRQPADAKQRIFLFQLLAVLGQWERALTQLNIAGELDPAARPMVQAYREALQCEALRQTVFAGQRSPLIFGEPEAWIAQLVEALRLGADGRHAEARLLRESAYAAAPAVGGSVDGVRFAWIADADTRLGPLLEVLVNGRYYWAPLHRLRALRSERPADLRDCVWMPVHLTWSNGGETVGFVPTRYAGTTQADDDALLLARRTDWIEPAEGSYWGLGQRMFATDAGEYALLDIGAIEFDEFDAPPGQPG
jgi:type VI secretion system protein ImpE